MGGGDCLGRVSSPQSVMTVLSAAEIAAARAMIVARDPVLAVADAALPPVEWRQRAPGFAGLVQLVVEQQVSVASAAAIWKRVEAGLGVVEPRAVLAHDIDALKRLGLSGPKAKYAQAIAKAHLAHEPNLDALCDLDDAAAIAALVTIKGVGRWTAETYLMFCEGRTDMFPAADIALQEALRVAEGGKARLSEKAFYIRAEAWRPYRGVAAHLLWDYYTALKRGDGASAR
jgi:DNA-3-methyladenine glycosylase II